LIEFDDKVKRLTPLKKVNKENIKEFEIVIKSLRDNGGTNIDLGMQAAFKAIKERKF
jgi:uncharacterized protein YegL